MATKTHLCPKYEYAMSLLGKRWSGLIIKAMMEGPCRFNELLSTVERVSDRVLTERLRELEAAGLVERRVYPESPVRIEYSLTPKGRDMEQVLEALQVWADKWVTPEEVMREEAAEKEGGKKLVTAS